MELTAFNKYGAHLLVKGVFSEIHLAAESDRQSTINIYLRTKVLRGPFFVVIF